MRRMRKRYEEFGYNGLFDQRRRKRIYLRVPMETAERVLALYRDTYFDLGCAALSREAGRRARDRNQLHVGEAGVARSRLVARRKKRGSHRRQGPGGRSRVCCCTSMAASIAGFPTTATTISL